jgi:hypothetical protein
MSLLFASAIVAQDKTVPQQGPPPANLTRLADGHFSANQEPINPDRFDVHVVRQGETLSGIAGQALRNPLLWPQLWEQNEHIINPHWIYPSDRILVRPVTEITAVEPPSAIEPATPETVAATGAAPTPPTPGPFALTPPRQPAQQAVVVPARPLTQDVFIVTPPKSYSEIKVGDVYCSGFVQVANVPEDFRVIAKHDASGGALATEAHYIYLSQGSESGLRAGDLFNVVRPTRKVEDLGTHYLEVGQLQVIMPQPEFALARVVHSCEAIELGDRIVPLQRAEVPTVPRPRSFSPFLTGTGGVIGSVVVTRDVLSNFGTAFKASNTIPGVGSGDLESLEMGVATEGGIVYLDLGQGDGIRVGDILLISRPVEIDDQLYDLPGDVDKLRSQRTAVGEVVVLKVRERASTGLVTYSTEAIYAGDLVERR